MILPAKPAYGSPCNGCGMCCIAAQCAISLALFDEQELCPALEQAGDALACGLMINTANYVPDLKGLGGKALTETFALILGSGIGCDAQGEGEERPTEGARDQIGLAAEAKIAAASVEARTLVEYFRSPS